VNGAAKKPKPTHAEQASEVAAMPGQSVAAALALEIMLIPEAALLLGVGRLAGNRDFLNLVATTRHQRAGSFRPDRCDDASGARAPVEAGQHCLPDLKRVEQIEQIPADGSLLAGPRRIARQKARCHLRHQHRAGMLMPITPGGGSRGGHKPCRCTDECRRHRQCGRRNDALGHPDNV
jgi:hypothetical protein